MNGIENPDEMYETMEKQLNESGLMVERKKWEKQCEVNNGRNKQMEQRRDFFGEGHNKAGKDMKLNRTIIKKDEGLRKNLKKRLKEWTEEHEIK